MITVTQLSNGLKSYLLQQIDSIALDTPIIGFIKPLLLRVINKNFNKIQDYAKLISDENGNIDIENILPEMIQSVSNSNPFTFNIPILGDIEIGGGFIKLNIPFTPKQLVFNTQDLQNLKDTLISNNY